MANVKEIIDLIEGGVNKKDEELINKAYGFAENAHLGQKRLSGDPYFVHVFETAKILAKFGMDTQTIVVGLLHDTLEDTKTTEEEIKKEFGDDILFLIKGVTKLGTLKYRGHERHVESLRKFFVAMANDLRVVIIKFADRLHNLRTLEFVPEEKRHRIAVESIEVYAPLVRQARELLRPGGLLVLELGYNSLERVDALVGAASGWMHVSITQDLAGIPRVLAAERT